MNTLILFLASTAQASIGPANTAGLPSWAQTVTRGLNAQAAPESAPVWRILDDRLMYFQDDGYIYTRRRIVQVVTRQSGADAAALFGHLNADEDEKIYKFKGWHKKSGGFLEEMGADDLVVVTNSRVNQLSTSQTVYASFQFVSAGSIIAFECISRKKSYLGPVEIFSVVGRFPVKHWRLTMRLQEDAEQNIATPITLVHQKGWRLDPYKTENQISFGNVPAIGGEALSSSKPDLYPMVLARFDIPGDLHRRYASWNQFAAWYHKIFAEVVYPGGMAKGERPFDLGALKKAASDMASRIVYRQVYMSPSRGWVPLSGEDVWRKSYGDCKDMVACAANRFGALDIPVFPAITSVGPGIQWTGKDPVNPFFNHLIAAIALPKSFDLDAEVEIEGQCYLIYDPTARQTPFGKLPHGLLGSSVLICTPSGGKWVTISEKAVETSALKVALTGKVDDQLNFSGQLRLEENGGELSLRYASETLNQAQFAQYMHQRLNLPSNAWLEVASMKQEAEKLVVACDLRVNEFLSRNGGTLQLAHGFFPASVPPLTTNGKARRNPLAFRPIANFHLSMNVALPWPMVPSKADIQWQGELGRYRYHATGGDHLVMSLELQLIKRDYAKGRLVTGLDQLKGFASRFNRDLWAMHHWKATRSGE